MRDSQRKRLIREIDEKWLTVRAEIGALFVWEDLSCFPPSSIGGGGSQIGTHSDPTGDRATAEASGAFDDPALKAVSSADNVLADLAKKLRLLERAVATAKPTFVMSDVDREQCSSCGQMRFTDPAGWTLGMHRKCYDYERRKATKNRKS